MKTVLIGIVVFVACGAAFAKNNTVKCDAHLVRINPDVPAPAVVPVVRTGPATAVPLTSTARTTGIPAVFDPAITVSATPGSDAVALKEGDAALQAKPGTPSLSSVKLPPASASPPAPASTNPKASKSGTKRSAAASVSKEEDHTLTDYELAGELP